MYICICTYKHTYFTCLYRIYKIYIIIHTYIYMYTYMYITYVFVYMNTIIFKYSHHTYIYLFAYFLYICCAVFPQSTTAFVLNTTPVTHTNSMRAATHCNILTPHAAIHCNTEFHGPCAWHDSNDSIWTLCAWHITNQQTGRNSQMSAL